MTTFRRSGHYRTNSNGTTFWVNGHEVNRNYWDGNSYSMSRSYQLKTPISHFRTLFSSFINPNAKCPVCGESVFYYESPYGGKVYFDSLGPPWPKHACIEPRATGKIRQNNQYQSWRKKSWQPYKVEKIEEKNGKLKISGIVLEEAEKEILYLENNAESFKKKYKNPCHIKILQNRNIIISTFELVLHNNNTDAIEHKFNGLTKKNLDIKNRIRTRIWGSRREKIQNQIDKFNQIISNYKLDSVSSVKQFTIRERLDFQKTLPELYTKIERLKQQKERLVLLEKLCFILHEENEKLKMNSPS